MRTRCARTWLALATATLTVGLSGCAGSSGGGHGGSGADGDGAAVKYVWGNASDAAALLKAVGDDAGTLAGKNGIKFARFNNNLDANTALTQARLMTQQNASVAINWTGVDSIGPAIGRLYKRAKLPCVAVNTPIDGCPFFKLDNLALGAQEAKAVIPIAKRRGWTASDTTVVLVDYVGGGVSINANPRSFYSTYAAAFPGMTAQAQTAITDSTTRIGDFSGYQVNGGGLLAGSYTAAKQALQVVPRSRHLVMVTVNDDSARGVLRAVDEAGRSSDVLLASEGGDADAVNQVRAGKIWVAEGAAFLNYWPAYAYAMAKALLAKASVPDVTVSPTVVLTPTNVDTYYSGTKQKKAPPVPGQDDYLLKYSLGTYVKQSAEFAP